MRSRTVKIICFLLLPAILLGYAVIRRHDKKPIEAATTTTSSPVVQLDFVHVEQEKEIGSAQAVSGYTDGYAFGVDYPVTGNKDIDLQIKQTAEKIAEDFTAGVKAHKSGKSAAKAVMTADYKAYVENDTKTYSYLSVVFEIATDIPLAGMPNRKIVTLFFDQNTGKPLKLEDIFTDGYLEPVAKKVTAYFKGDKSYSDYTQGELFDGKTAPAAENFSNFAFYNGNLVFYFDSMALFPEEFGCPCAVIPVNELYKNLKVKMSEKAIVTPVKTTDKLLALTFDDGPRPSVTNRILDALEKSGGRVTFFPLGLMIDGQASNDAILRAYEMGCEIGNHSYSHKKFSTSLSAKDLKFQVEKPNEMLEQITGERPRLFRLPYGYTDARVIVNVHMPLISWNVDPKDWAYKDDPQKNRTKAQRDIDQQKVINGILNVAQDGDIVIMHDIYTFSAEVCEAVFPELVKRGFKLVTVSEMFELRGKPLRDSVVYKEARN